MSFSSVLVWGDILHGDEFRAGDCIGSDCDDLWVVRMGEVAVRRGGGDRSFLFGSGGCGVGKNSTAGRIQSHRSGSCAGWLWARGGDHGGGGFGD